MSILWRNAEDWMPGPLRGSTVAMGNFDGFHLGHQAVAGHAVDWAKEEGRPAMIATFDPHPVRFFRPDTPPFRLTTLEQRHQLFAEVGARAMIVFHFNAALAALEPEAFIRDVLVRRLGFAAIVTGEDFTFGKGRKGNVDTLRDIGALYGLRAATVSPVGDHGEIVSSSRIRDALRQGECEEAARLLTRPFTIRGEVIHGAKQGRQLGFPTANMLLGHYLRPKYGIYAVKGRLPDGRMVKGVANLGIRPSFDPPVELLEPWFFDFSEDLYGQTIEIELHHFLRPEAKFDDLEALRAQMAKDADAARALLA